jgi:hypothetical protein
MRPSTSEAPAALLPPPPLRLLPGGAIQFPGGFISRCGPVPFTAHCNRLWVFKNSFQGISAAKFVRKLLIVRSPWTLKLTEITAFFPFSTATPDFNS